MTLGMKLQLLRKQNGLSQEQLADRLNVSRQAISKWELDAALPDTANVIALSRLFRVSTDYLLKDDMETPVEGASKKPTTARLAGIICGSVGVLGLAVIYIISRCVPVMIPDVQYENGVKSTIWNNSITGIDLMQFISQYKLQGLLGLFASLIVTGILLATCDRWLPGLKKFSRSLI